MLFELGLMVKLLSKLNKRMRRSRRVRRRVRGASEQPRLSVFRSSRHIYAQLIDDENSRTLLAVNSLMLKDLPDRLGGTKSDKAAGSTRRKESIALLVGKELGARAIKRGIRQVRFDRGPYKYHGRVAKVAEGAREAGLKL